MHCPCLSRPSLESDETFLLIQISQSLHKPWCSLSLFLQEIAGQTFWRARREESPAVRRDGKGDLWWKAQLSMPAGVSPAFLIPVAGTAYPCESSASSSPAVTAPCLWLSLPEPVIISNQGKVPAHAVRGDGSAACWSSLCLGNPGKCSMSGPGSPITMGWKMPLAKLACNLGLLNVPGSKTYQGFKMCILII